MRKAIDGGFEEKTGATVGVNTAGLQFNRRKTNTAKMKRKIEDH